MQYYIHASRWLHCRIKTKHTFSLCREENRFETSQRGEKHKRRTATPFTAKRFEHNVTENRNFHSSYIQSTKTSYLTVLFFEDGHYRSICFVLAANTPLQDELQYKHNVTIYRRQMVANIISYTQKSIWLRPLPPVRFSVKSGFRTQRHI